MRRYLTLRVSSFYPFSMSVHYLGNAAHHNRKCHIVPRHLVMAVRNDEEMNRLLVMGSVSIFESSESASPTSDFLFGSGSVPFPSSNVSAGISDGDNPPAASSESSGFLFGSASTDQSDPQLGSLLSEIRFVLDLFLLFSFLRHW